MTFSEALRGLPDTRILTEESMADHTSFKIGGPAELFVQPSAASGVNEIMRLCRVHGIPLTVLGDGSNVLVPDAGLRGVVLQTSRMADISVEGNRITAGAGVKLMKLAETACKAALGGLAFASGIPGTVGGAVYMNAGAYGHDIQGVCQSVDILLDGEVTKLSADEMKFGYRHSILIENGGLVLSAVFQLEPGDTGEIKKYTQELMEKRRSTQPLAFPSAGSVFKRPPGLFAGKLIMDCGLKGFFIGGAQVSLLHAGFIVNTGGATAEDVLKLIEHIQKTVQKNFNVWLEPEIRLL
jgi:UDP-N-acetylmuramate dehydrogenase